MNSEFEHELRLLEQNGWQIRRSASPRELPSHLTSRYPWIPQDVREFVEGLDLAVAPEEKAWLLAWPDYEGSAETPYAWNEWELDSLKEARDDLDWASRIRRFWDSHFPVLTSVKSCYAYFAIRQTDLRIVCGAEPEYEETLELAPSFLDLLRMLRSGQDIAPWI
jgi:hypothetical protein